MKISDFYRELIVMLLVGVTINVLSAETRRKIAVMDTGFTITEQSKPYLCTEDSVDFTGTGLQDNDGHGTNVVGLITKDLDPTKWCIVMIKYYNTSFVPSMYDEKMTLYKSWNYLGLLTNVTFVNLSYSGTGFWQEEFNTLKSLTNNGTIVIVSAGNDKKDLSQKCDVFPACYNIRQNFFVVGTRDSYSNFNRPNEIYSDGTKQKAWGTVETGTSQACANATNELAKMLK